MILYSEFTDGSRFSEEKNGLEICFLVDEIFNKQSKKTSVGSVQPPPPQSGVGVEDPFLGL